jgi:hypothetical protein
MRRNPRGNLAKNSAGKFDEKPSEEWGNFDKKFSKK